MKIIVVGCGKVGYTLSEHLLEEGHEITIIDTKHECLDKVSATLDINTICGNGVSYRDQIEAGIESADILIAVTSKDEINLLSCLIAKKAGDCLTIARVRDPQYYEEIAFLKEELGITMSINPELATASEITKLIQIPSAMDVASFDKGRVNMIQMQIPKDSALDGIRISECSSSFKYSMLICVVERAHEIIIPRGDFVLKAGDDISVILPMEHANSFFNQIGIDTKPIKRVLIAGGGTISYYLAKMLFRMGIQVKIIEEKMDICERLSEQLPGAMIIQGDATDLSLLMEEGIKKMDAIVSLTNLDEENILLSLHAGRITKAKVITKITKSFFEEIIEDMPIGSLVSPKQTTAEYILRYVRSLQNSISCDNVKALYRLVGNRVEAMEFVVDENSCLKGRKLESLRTIDNLLIGCINRGGKTIIPTGKDSIEAGDSVIIVTMTKGLKSIDDILK